MRWRGRERSKNVEDIRAKGPAAGGGLAIGGGIGIVIAIVVLLMGDTFDDRVFNSVSPR